MANDTDKNLARRIEDQRPAAAIDWSKPGAPAVPLPGTAGAAQGGNTSIEGLGEYVWTEAGDKVLVADLKAAILPPLTAPAPLTDELPAILFDGHAVYSEITLHLGRGHCFTPEAVSATLDAVVRLMRAERKSVAPAPQQSEGLSDDQIMDIAEPFHDINGVKFDEVAFARALLSRAKAAPAAPVQTADVQRYQRLRILGAAPGGSKQLDAGTVLRFQNLDDFVDADIAAYPSRGEASESVAAPVQAEQAQAEPVAYLHQVVSGDGEPDQALSFAPDNFPLARTLGYRSLSHQPLYAAPVAALPAQAEQVAAVRAAELGEQALLAINALIECIESNDKISAAQMRVVHADNLSAARSAIDGALATKEAAAPVQAVKEQWISVDERLPDLHVTVALLDENRWMNTGGSDHNVNWHGAGYLCEFGGKFWSIFGESRSQCLEAVTHWMLMPDAPSTSEASKGADRG
jgi:hypothetical protein